MKKITLLSFILLLFTITSHSQTKIGVLAGINMSKLSGDVEPDTKYKSKTGGNFGVFLDLKVAKNIYISLQPSYSQEGTKITHKVKESYTPIDTVKISLNYFSLPILFKVASTNEKFYALGGIESAKLLTSSKTPVGGEKTDLTANIKPWNFTIQFGAGMRFPIGKTTLFLEARYAQGLNNITDDSIVNDLIPRVKTSSIKLLTGIEIPLETSKK